MAPQAVAPPQHVVPSDVVYPADAYFLGDLDSDGLASVGDAIKILRIVVSLDDDDPCADANQNGSTDVGDAIMVLRCVVGLDTWPIGTVGPVETYEFVARWGMWGFPDYGDGQFNDPQGIAVDGAGNVYVADMSNARIQKFTSAGVFLGWWGGAGWGYWEDFTWHWVDDTGWHGPGSSTEPFSGSGDGQFDGPNGIAIDASGNVYVCERWNHRVQKFTREGTFLGWWGRGGNWEGDPLFSPWVDETTGWHGPGSGQISHMGSGDGQFWGPMHVAVDAATNVYVADSSNFRIQKFTSDGTFLTKWGSAGNGDGQFLCPSGIAVDAATNVYVSDICTHRIEKFTSGGTFLGWWGQDTDYYTGWHSPGSGKTPRLGHDDGQFWGPGAVAVDAAGNVYVADSGNDRIQKFTSNGVFLTKFGSSFDCDVGQGIVLGGIAVDADGNVYVSDSNSASYNINFIYKFRPVAP